MRDACSQNWAAPNKLTASEYFTGRQLDNRPVAVQPGASPGDGDRKAAFAYDYMNRRIEKRVWTWDAQASPPTWELTDHRRFVYDGWLLLLEIDVLGGTGIVPVKKYTWGLDLAGQSGAASAFQGAGWGEGARAGLYGGAAGFSPRGPSGAAGASALDSAGGIGGLLAMQDTNGTTTGEDPEADDLRYVYTYDANGNVGQLVDLSAPSAPAAVVAHYEYDPYGNNRLNPDDPNQSGPYAGANPIRWSTKYWDAETGLGYWGERYYDPRLGRWLNRDPIGERGGRNIYRYGANDPLGRVDPIGHFLLGDPPKCPTTQTQPTSRPTSGPSEDPCSKVDWGRAARGPGQTADAGVFCDGKGNPIVCLRANRNRGVPGGAAPPDCSSLVSDYANCLCEAERQNQAEVARRCPKACFRPDGTPTPAGEGIDPGACTEGVCTFWEIEVNGAKKLKECLQGHFQRRRCDYVLKAGGPEWSACADLRDDIRAAEDAIKAYTESLAACQAKHSIPRWRWR